MTFAFFYRASLGGPDERREQKFATLVGESFLNVTHKYFTHTTMMEGKPIYYDGSGHPPGNGENAAKSEPFTLTDEIRKQISGNPFVVEQSE
ncbi:hypothetical protein P9204_14585 [Geobacillus stearothermophilus]|nr:hypothetical protein [Geobacillus stearothermophilus]